MSNPLSGSPLAPAHRRDTVRSLPIQPPRLEPPVYGTPTAATRFFPLHVPELKPHDEAVARIMHALFIKCWLCGKDYGARDKAWFHVCWSGRLQCPFCRTTHQAICKRGQWQVPEHDCRILAPFLDEVRRLQCRA